jgi:FO synthase
LFAARGEAFAEVCAAADALRRETNGDTVSYIVTRNVNYTNICSYRCSFCAFSKGKTADHLRGKPYELEISDVVARCREAWERGAVEVCLQGGIHPDYTGAFYLSLCRALKAELPDLHLHAFSPLETFQGAKTLELTPSEFLGMLRDAGLGTLPGTAAEVLDPEVRAIICPDKVTVEQWIHVVESAHRAGLRTTATIMFGHVDTPEHWARHLLHLRRLQGRTGGITEFVPLPFVAMESPINLRGQSRLGPTFRESVLMHAVSRIVFHGLIENIQTSWVKMGTQGAQACLNAGANDVGGTLMNESITRAAGAAHGQEMTPAALESLIRGIGRTPRQRTTLYGTPSPERTALSQAAPALPLQDRAAASG